MSEIFEALDLESAEHVLNSQYGKMRIGARDQRRGMRLVQAFLTQAVRFDHIIFRMSIDVEAAPLGALIVGEVKSGELAHSSDGSRRLLRAGEVYLAAQPGLPFTGDVRNTESQLAVIDPALLIRVADTGPGGSRHPVRFTGYAPVSPQAAQAWRDTYAHVRDVVLANPNAAAQPLLASGAAQLLAATALAVFPNNALTDPATGDRRDAHPATLRRAVAFIDENAHRDISVADIAAGSFVTVRAVQLAFRRHMGTTPMKYLRRVRLDHAHQDLKRAAPGDGLTVTTVAYRWGFRSSSKFTAAYRRVYGVTPSHTLYQG